MLLLQERKEMKKLESRSECATDERLRKKANRNLASSSRPQKLPSHLATKLLTPHSLFLVYFPFSLPSHSHKSWSLSLIRFCASPFPCRVETMTIFRCLNPPKCLHTHTETQENTKTTVLTQYTLHMYYSRENLRSFLVCVYGTEERKRRINGKLVGEVQWTLPCWEQHCTYWEGVFSQELCPMYTLQHQCWKAPTAVALVCVWNQNTQWFAARLINCPQLSSQPFPVQISHFPFPLKCWTFISPQGPLLELSRRIVTRNCWKNGTFVHLHAHTCSCYLAATLCHCASSASVQNAMQWFTVTKQCTVMHCSCIYVAEQSVYSLHCSCSYICKTYVSHILIKLWCGK